MAELADAIDLGSIPKGWGFESLYPHHVVARRLMQRAVCLTARLRLLRLLLFPQNLLLRKIFCGSPILLIIYIIYLFYISTIIYH